MHCRLRGLQLYRGEQITWSQAFGFRNKIRYVCTVLEDEPDMPHEVAGIVSWEDLGNAMLRR